MRILMFSWEYPPHVVGGIGTHVSALIPALSRHGVEVTLVTPRWSGGDAISHIGDNAVVYRVDPPEARMGNLYADAQQTNLNLQDQAQQLWLQGGDGTGANPHGFDLIHAHDWLVAFAADSLKRLHKTPLVATMHATERGRGRGNLNGEMAYAINGTEWWLAYEAWRVITASRYMGDEVRNYFQLPSDKIDVVPNGVETLPFDALDGTDLSDFRIRWASPQERLVFFVGRLQYEKGPQVLVEAAPRVLAEFPQAKLVIAGSGGMLESLRRRAFELGVADKVIIPGYISDNDRNCLLKVANVAVFPSLYEPFGIVALEAMAAKCPVVAADVGGLQEVVCHEQTGLIVHSNDVVSLAWGIGQTLRNPGAAATRAANAYHTVREEYNWDRIAERTIEVYDRVVGERARVVWS